MRRITSLLGAVTLSALSLAGCYKGKDGQYYPSENSKLKADAEFRKEAKQQEGSFAEIPMWREGMAMTSGDFNRDGNLDFIVGVYKDWNARLYLFEGDGKGNFKLKTYPK